MTSTINMDIVALRSFVLAEKLGSFTSASQSLHCSQTALSLRIKKLEEQLGTSLFHRNYHTLRLTSSGRLFLPEAIAILNQHDRTVDVLRKKNQKEVIKLGLEEDQATYFFQNFMANQSQANDNIEIEIIMRLSHELIKMTNENKLDISIVSTMPDQLTDETHARTDLKWVCSPNFSYQPEQDLPLSLHPEGCFYREYIIKLLKVLGIPYRIIFSAQGSMSVQAAVIAGMGLTVIAENNIPSELRVAPDEWNLPELGQKGIRLIQADDISPAQLLFIDELQERFLNK